MSRVCMLGHPAHGHINPTLPVIAELVRRGDRVTYFATEPFRAKVEQTGATCELYGAQELFERNLASGGMLGGMAGLIETTERILPALLARVRAAEPDYLLVEAHAVWGNLLAQVLRIPTITLCSMFAINDALITAAGLMRHMYGEAPPGHALQGLLGLSLYAEAARRLQARFGVACPGIIDYLGNRQALNIVFTSRAFQVGGDLFGDDYAFVGPSMPETRAGTPAGTPARTAASAAGDVNADADLSWLNAAPGDDRPLIYVSMGTMYNDDVRLYRACVEALGHTPYRVVMAVGHRVDRRALPAPPDNFILREFVPQVAVLRRAALFITHGGINSAHEAMWHGVPMIVLPCAADHHIVAERVAAVGAGVVLDRSQATADRLRDLVTRVLADDVCRGHSARMGETLREAGGCRRAADAIQRCTGRTGARKD
jgi:UDP:flavonoid glycosyltransferase YjiC (YdhE family)